jgi:hypothetical protein
MLTTLTPEQVAAEAFNVKGEATLVLVEGLLTVTPARAGTVRVRAITEARVRFRASFIKFPFRLHFSAWLQDARSPGELKGFQLYVGMSEMRAHSADFLLLSNL